MNLNAKALLRAGRVPVLALALLLGPAGEARAQGGAEWPEAWVRLERVLVRAPDQEAAWERLAGTVSAARRQAEWAARLEAQAGTATGAESAGWWALRARLAERLGDADAALAGWTRVVELLDGGVGAATDPGGGGAPATVPESGTMLAVRRAVAAAAGRRGDWETATRRWTEVAERAADAAVSLAAWREAARAAVRGLDGPAARRAWAEVAGREEPGSVGWTEALGGLLAVGAATEWEAALRDARQRVAGAESPAAWLAIEEAAWPLTLAVGEGWTRAIDVLARLGRDHPDAARWRRRGAEGAMAAGALVEWAVALTDLAARGAGDFGAAFDAWLAAGEPERAAELWERNDTGLRTGPAAPARARALAKARGDWPTWRSLARTEAQADPTDPARAADWAEAAWEEWRATGGAALAAEIELAWAGVLQRGDAAAARAAAAWAVGRGLADLAEAAVTRRMALGGVTPRVRTEAVEALLAVGRREAAEAVAAADGGPWTESGAALEAARRWRLLGRAAEAGDVLARATADFPGEFSVWEARWQFLVEQRDEAAARALFEGWRAAAGTATRRAEVETRHLRLLRGTPELAALAEQARAWTGGPPEEMAWLWRAALEAEDMEALERLAAAAAALPADPDRAALADETARRRGDPHGRLAAWRRLAVERPEWALQAWRRVVAVAVGERLWDAAAEAVAELVRRQPGDPEVRRWEAEVALGQGDKPRARRTLEEALRLGGGTPEMRSRLIQLQMEAGETRAAWPWLLAAARDPGGAGEVLPVLIEAAAALGRLPEAVAVLEATAPDPVERAKRRAAVADLLGDPAAALTAWLEVARWHPEDAEARGRLREAVRRAPTAPRAAEALGWLVRTETDPARWEDLAVAWAAAGGGEAVLDEWDRRGAVASPAAWLRLGEAFTGPAREALEARWRRLAESPEAPWAVLWVEAEQHLAAGRGEEAVRNWWALLARRAELLPDGQAVTAAGPDTRLQQALNARQRYLVLRRLAPSTGQVPPPPATLAEAQTAALVHLAGWAGEQGTEAELFAELRRWMDEFRTPRPQRAMLWLGMQARGPLMDEIEGMLAAGEYHAEDYRFLYEVLVNTRLANRAGDDGPRLQQLEVALAREIVRREPAGRAAFGLAAARRLRDFARRNEAGAVLREHWEAIRVAALPERLDAIRLAWETLQGDLARELLAELRPVEVRRSAPDLAVWLGPAMRALGQGHDPAVEEAALRALWLARAVADAARSGTGTAAGAPIDLATLWQPPFPHPRLGTTGRAELAGLMALVRPGPAAERLWRVADGLRDAGQSAAERFHLGYLAASLAARMGETEWAAAWWREQAQAQPDDPWCAWAAARSTRDPAAALALLPESGVPVLSVAVAVRRLELLDALGMEDEARAAAQVVSQGPPLTVPGVDLAALVVRHGGRWPPSGRIPGAPGRPLILPTVPPVPAGADPATQEERARVAAERTMAAAVAQLERPPGPAGDAAAAETRRAAWRTVAAGPEWEELVARRERQLALAPAAARWLMDLAEAYEARATVMGSMEAGERAAALWRELARLPGLERPWRGRVEGVLMATSDWRELGEYLLALPATEPTTVTAAALVAAAQRVGQLAEFRRWAETRAVNAPGWTDGPLGGRAVELGRALEALPPTTDTLPYWRALAAVAGDRLPDDVRRRLVAGAATPEAVVEAAAWLADPFLATGRPVRRDTWLGRLAEERAPRWAQAQGGPGGLTWPLGEAVLEARPAVRAELSRRWQAAPETVRNSAGGRMLALLLAVAEGDDAAFAAHWQGLAGSLWEEPAPPSWAGEWLREVKVLLLAHVVPTRADRTTPDPLLDLFEEAGRGLGTPAACWTAATLAMRRGTWPEAEWAVRLERLPEIAADQDPTPVLEALRLLTEAGQSAQAAAWWARRMGDGLATARPGGMAAGVDAAMRFWKVLWGEDQPGWKLEPTSGGTAEDPPGPAWRVTAETGHAAWFRRDLPAAGEGTEVAAGAVTSAATAGTAWLAAPEGPRVPAAGWPAIRAGEPEPVGLQVRAVDAGAIFGGEPAWQVRASGGRPAVWVGTLQEMPAEATAELSLWVRAWPGSTVALGWRYLAEDGRLLGQRLGGVAPATGAWMPLRQAFNLTPPLPRRGDLDTPPRGTARIEPFLHLYGEAEVALPRWRPGL